MSAGWCVHDQSSWPFYPPRRPSCFCTADVGRYDWRAGR
jgi:hypothetical protein